WYIRHPRAESRVTTATAPSLPSSLAAAADPPRRPIEPVALLALPATLFLAVAFALPLALLLLASFVDGGRFSVGGYARFLSDPFSWAVLANTLRAAASTTVICLLAGYPVAFALARAGGRPQGLLLAALIVPLSVGVVVKAFSWTILLRSDG